MRTALFDFKLETTLLSQNYGRLLWNLHLILSSILLEVDFRSATQGATTVCAEAQNRMHITIGVAGVSPHVSKLNVQLRDNTENEFHGYKLVIVKPV